MTTFNNGESLSSVRTKINEAIDKVDGNAAFDGLVVSGDMNVEGSSTLGTTSAVTGGTADGLNVVGASNGLLAKFGGNRTVYDRALQLNEFAVGGVNNVGFQFNAEGTGTIGELRFAVAGTNVVTISDDNYVGIGTTDPVVELHIKGSTPQVRLQPTSDVQNNRIEFCNTAGTVESKIMSGGVLGSTIQLDGDVEIIGAVTVAAADPFIKLTDTSTGADHEIDANSGVGNLVINTDISGEGSDPKLLLKVSGTTGITVRDTGDVAVAGALSKGSGSFKIDHPLKPETHHLVHSFVEAPQADNIYRGKVALVDGSATVNLDEAGRMTEGTFVALNGNIQCFTSNEDGWTAVRGSVSGNTLTIQAQDASCTDTVSWLVIGERHDQHMIDTDWTDAEGRVITEPERQAEEDE